MSSNVTQKKDSPALEGTLCVRLSNDAFLEYGSRIGVNMPQTMAQQGTVGFKIGISCHEALLKFGNTSWDCNIEDFAFNQALTCKDPPDVPAPPTVDPKFGVAMEVVSTKSACDPTTVTKDTLKKWWKEGLKKQADAALVADNKLFNAMAYSKTTNFACTYSMCQSRKFYLLCFYNKEAADPLYAAGALPDYCNKCDPNTVTCINGLCAPPYELICYPTYHIHSRFHFLALVWCLEERQKRAEDGVHHGSLSSGNRLDRIKIVTKDNLQRNEWIRISADVFLLDSKFSKTF
ncbi:hypothetical protein Y032_0574g177 [Ancylostoma ceylanicum]|uniref:SCP domain-containing protein n=1 Tax=Ancylostoma ceylanicum TaxID=53326 RepID=A0A016WNV8_9BILA|nr:hypothetical protein Y032_0574g177 [Ancylostoma ceylanicum]